MGFFKRNKKKNNNKKAQQQLQQQSGKSSAAAAAAAVSSGGPASTASSNNVSNKSNRQQRWSPIRISHSKQKNATAATATGNGGDDSKLLNSLNVLATDNVEVVTPESQRVLMAQREAIRRQLFDGSNTVETTGTVDEHDEMVQHRSAAPGYQQEEEAATVLDDSQEVYYDDNYNRGVTLSKYDQFSMPMSAAVSSWDYEAEKAAAAYKNKEQAAVPAAATVSPDGSPASSSRQTSDDDDDDGVASPENRLINTSADSNTPSLFKGMPGDERKEYRKDEMAYDGGLNRSSEPDSSTREQQLSSSYFTDASSMDFSSAPGSPSTPLARQLMQAAFQCGGTGTLGKTLQTTAEETCGGGGVVAADSNKEKAVPPTEESSSPAAAPASPPTRKNQRPQYMDDTSVLRFLRRISNNGFVLLNLVQEDDDDDWNGRTVTLMIHKGRGDQMPKLEWTTVAGGLHMVTKTTSVNLLDILSIDTDANASMDEEEIEDDNVCFFSVTTEDGHVHIFEAANVDERDRIVNGLRTVISRWVFHLIAGDCTATSELYTSHVLTGSNSSGRQRLRDYQFDEDMPSLPNPNHTMNHVAHALLEA